MFQRSQIFEFKPLEWSTFCRLSRPWAKHGIVAESEGNTPKRTPTLGRYAAWGIITLAAPCENMGIWETGQTGQTAVPEGIHGAPGFAQEFANYRPITDPQIGAVPGSKSDQIVVPPRSRNPETSKVFKSQSLLAQSFELVLALPTMQEIDYGVNRLDSRLGNGRSVRQSSHGFPSKGLGIWCAHDFGPLFLESSFFRSGGAV